MPLLFILSDPPSVEAPLTLKPGWHRAVYGKRLTLMCLWASTYDGVLSDTSRLDLIPAPDQRARALHEATTEGEFVSRRPVASGKGPSLERKRIDQSVHEAENNLRAGPERIVAILAGGGPGTRPQAGPRPDRLIDGMLLNSRFVPSDWSELHDILCKTVPIRGLLESEWAPRVSRAGLMRESKLHAQDLAFVEVPEWAAAATASHDRFVWWLGASAPAWQLLIADSLVCAFGRLTFHSLVLLADAHEGGSVDATVLDHLARTSAQLGAGLAKSQALAAEVPEPSSAIMTDCAVGIFVAASWNLGSHFPDAQLLTWLDTFTVDDPDTVTNWADFICGVLDLPSRREDAVNILDEFNFGSSVFELWIEYGSVLKDLDEADAVAQLHQAIRDVRSVREGAP